MPFQSPEQALAAYEMQATIDVDWYVGWSIEGESLWNLSVNSNTFCHTAVALAIMGHREPVSRLGDWVERALSIVISHKDPALTPPAYDKLMVFRWLRHGEPDQTFLGQRAEAWTGQDGADAAQVVAQVLRLIDANRPDESRRILTALRPSTPTLVRSLKSLTPTAAVAFALDVLNGQEPTPANRQQFLQLLGRLRRETFPKGLFADIIPWVRLYNRLFMHEVNSWQMAAWLKKHVSGRSCW